MKLEIVDDCCGHARKLVAEGCDPEEILEFYRGEMLCLRGRAKTFARQRVKETESIGPVHVPWEPLSADRRQRLRALKPQAGIPARVEA